MMAEGGMMLKTKYFTHTIKDIPGNITSLRKLFPGYTFFNGKCNGIYGTYAVSDPTPGKNEFLKPIKCKELKDYLWFPPTEFELTQEYLDEHEKSKSCLKIKVELDCGFEIKIIPATAEPRKIALCLYEDPEEEAILVSPYGKKAYEIDEKLYNQKEVTFIDVAPLINLGFLRSYNISIDLINYFGLIGTGDLQNITYACLGYDEGIEKKEEDS